MSDSLEEEEVKSVIFPLFFHHPPQHPHTLPQDKEQFVFPGKHVPTYALGWMIKVPRITDFGNHYGSYQERFILPRWKEAGFPDWYTPPRNHGFMVPSLFGNDHIFIQLAENTPQALALLNMYRSWDQANRGAGA
ncbi:hypothetical protein D9611_008827 [Ephemerocybe angulata]|uniref:Uncharacterized protein n=1 Tax=Ephemerocybe angulata TaxID=980116 RepID=A0A8H5BZC0_9AGAR|nr:hypothetical protein D9611_008827 [Tulosesus angulatus]